MLWIFSLLTVDLLIREYRIANSDKQILNDTNFPNLRSDKQINLDMIDTIKIMWRTRPIFWLIIPVTWKALSVIFQRKIDTREDFVGRWPRVYFYWVRYHKSPIILRISIGSNQRKRIIIDLR